MPSAVTRRAFVAELGQSSFAAALLLQLPLLSSLTGCARATGTWKHLSVSEAASMRAFAARILPSEPGVPGAEEAGAAHFVDQALARPFFASLAPLIHRGLAELDERARAVGAERGFASLPESTQIRVMRQMERQPFFAAARTLVLAGTFADAAYGGNRSGAGFTIIGMHHEPAYSAPFGWYDAEAAATHAGAA
jgi:gluconate 2-dehydrogenase subunit 3-like protein